jgi:hypothetical protein
VVFPGGNHETAYCFDLHQLRNCLSAVETKTLSHERETSMSALEEFPRITPFLWFDNNAEDAVNFYLSVFKNSRRLEVQQNAGGAPGPADILTIAFELDGQTFTALNGGPLFKFTEAGFLCRPL